MFIVLNNITPRSKVFSTLLVRFVVLHVTLVGEGLQRIPNTPDKLSVSASFLN